MSQDSVYAVNLATSTSMNPTGMASRPSQSTYAVRLVNVIAIGGALAVPGTTSGGLLSPGLKFDTPEHSAHRDRGDIQRISQTQHIEKYEECAISELRCLSGLTWEQLAELFDVSRRSIHFWASGKPLTVSHEWKLHHILAVIRELDRGSARANRECLVQVREGGVTLLELLKQGKFEKVLSMGGLGRGRNSYDLAPLAAEDRMMRSPQKPEELVGAIQESLPLADKKVRRARVAKKKA